MARGLRSIQVPLEIGAEIRKFSRKGETKKDRLKYTPGSKVNPINVHPKELYNLPARNIELAKRVSSPMKRFK